MTMENGEGRPPDDEATGAEDPQAWYFDLPRGAWERQEQKNRALRERVLGNIAEDAEKAKGDPFVPRPAEPEPPARRGFLAFGRKKKQDDAPRRDDADGSWTLDRPDGMRHQEPTDADAEDDDWSTEIPLRAEPEPPLTLRRSVHHEEAEPWGTADAGFVLGSPEAARPVEHTPSAEAGDDGWSGAGSEMPLAEHIEEPAASDRDQAFEETVMPSFSGPQATDVDPNPPDEDFLAGMRSWARGDADSGTTSNEGNAGEERLHTDDVLQLRPRPHDPGEPRLDWSFGPAGWSEPGEQPATSPAAEPQADDEADMIESMRRWAERSKESVHPHFALQHHEEEAELTPEPPPIPLRPRHHDEPWQRPESDGNSEPEPGAGAPPTRWDEFFGIDRGARPDDDEDEGAGVSEGLAAMRDWARKRAAAEHGGEIPEEFLKPFDWELDESTSQGSDAAALAHEGFAAGPEADGPGAELVLEFAAYLEDAEYRATEEREPTLEFAGEGEAVQQDTDEDPLAGIFGTPPAAAPGVEPREKKRGGMFGRLFGRKKQEDTQAFEVAAPAVAGAAPDGRSDEDMRTVSADAGEWLPYEEADVQAAVVEPDLEPFSASAEETLDADEPAEPWAVPAPFVARAGDDQEGDWAEADEPGPAILPREFVTAFEQAVPRDQRPAPEVSAYSPEAGDDEFAWEPEPIAFEEPVAQAETTPEEAPATATPAIQLTLDAFAPGEPAGEEPVTDEKPWWEQPVVEEVPAEAVASIEPAAAPDDDDPWADFVSAEPETTAPARFEPGATHFGPSGTAWEPAPPPAAQPDDDMWGAIAAQAEEAASAPDESHDVDLAASLESRMAAEFDAPPAWETPERYRESTGYDDDSAVFEPDDSEEDVILRAFERHASMPDPEETSNPEAERETQEALAALFGQDASRIVDEAIEEPEPQSFIRMTGFAPQRSSESFDGGWAPQQEVEEAFTHDRVTFGTDGDGFAPPPWATAEFGGEGEATPVEAGSKTRTWIRELVETGLLALLVFLSVRASFQNFKVDGNSMYPTLEDGQFLIVNKLVYSEVDVEKLSKFIPFVDPGDDPKRNVFHGPERGDIVVLRDPRKPETDLIKRVIGLPGETVEIVGGKVYINDRLLEEPYITTPWNDTRPKILIPEGEYYVLGDNRDNSLDSRSSQVGLVPKDLIIGKAMLSYWPRDKFGLAPNEGGSLSDQKPVLTTRQLGED